MRPSPTLKRGANVRPSGEFPVIDDLLWHELEVVKSFYARAMTWVATECASEDVRLEGASEESIEFAVTHHNGPYCFEQIVIRSVLNELNALCEFAMQETWRTVSNQEALPSGELIFTAARHSIEEALSARGVDVKGWHRWQEVLKIKELSEAYKHRQRLQPFPAELQKRGFEWRAKRLVDPGNVKAFAPYDITRTQAAESMAVVEELLLWLRTHAA